MKPLPINGFGTAVPVIVTRPDGSEHSYESQCGAARAEKISQSILCAMCNGRMKQWKGYTVRRAILSNRPGGDE
jgi:hypothetical protein